MTDRGVGKVTGKCGAQRSHFQQQQLQYPSSIRSGRDQFEDPGAQSPQGDALDSELDIVQLASKCIRDETREYIPGTLVS
jgi:hypothetical protein